MQLVLRSTSDLRVWKTVLVGLLIADFGHLYSVHSLGYAIYYRAWSWNAMHWGNIGFVYVGASKCSSSTVVPLIFLLEGGRLNQANVL